MVAVSGVTPELPAWAFHWGGFPCCGASLPGAQVPGRGLSVHGLQGARGSVFAARGRAVVPAVERRRGVCDLPGVPCIARRTLNHWITGEAV